MKNYIINKIDDKDYSYIIFGINYESPLLHLDLIEKELSEKKAIKKIIFDQLLQTGDGDNRFLEIYFDKNKFDLTTAKNISKTKTNYKKYINNFLKINGKILNNSILNSNQIQMINEGVLV